MAGGDNPNLIKPFTAQVNGNGIAVVTVTQTNHGLAWVISQIGFSLGLAAPSPQIAAHVNGIPLTVSATMQTSPFASIPGAAPYAMESFFFGPPYITLESGDQLVCGVNGAISGDTFTVGAYLSEIQSPAMTASIQGSQQSNAYIQRAGSRRWS